MNIDHVAVIAPRARVAVVKHDGPGTTAFM
jgi:hypothetical protein